MIPMQRDPLWDDFAFHSTQTMRMCALLSEREQLPVSPVACVVSGPEREPVSVLFEIAAGEYVHMHREDLAQERTDMIVERYTADIDGFGSAFHLGGFLEPGDIAQGWEGEIYAMDETE